jgi:hypothetical protein
MCHGNMALTYKFLIMMLRLMYYYSSLVTVNVHLQCRSLQLKECLDQGLITNITLKPVPVFDVLSCIEATIMVLHLRELLLNPTFDVQLTCHDYKR